MSTLNRCLTGILVTTAVLVSACAGRRNHMAVGNQIPRDVVFLHVTPARDSLVLRRDSITVILSMADVEERASQPHYDPSGRYERFFRTVRQEYADRGWVELEFKGDAERLAGELIVRGRAAMRLEPNTQYVPWVRVVREHDERSAWRAIYLPTGEMFLRLIDMVVTS